MANTLDEKLRQVLGQSTGLLYASLNPYHADEYFCIFKDSSCTFKFPSTVAFRDFEKKLLLVSTLRVIIDSPTLRSSTDAVPAPKPAEVREKGKPGFAEQITIDAVKDVLKDAEEKDVTRSFAAINTFISDNM